MTTTEKVNIANFIKLIEQTKKQADRHYMEDSAQGCLSDLLHIFLESVAEVDLGFTFCDDCNCLTDELANDDVPLCPDCEISARHRAYDRLAYLTRHE